MAYHTVLLVLLWLLKGQIPLHHVALSAYLTSGHTHASTHGHKRTHMHATHTHGIDLLTLWCNRDKSADKNCWLKSVLFYRSLYYKREAKYGFPASYLLSMLAIYWSEAYHRHIQCARNTCRILAGFEPYPFLSNSTVGWNSGHYSIR